MGVALAAITIGAWFAYSALAGKSLTDVFKDPSTSTQNPAGTIAVTPSAAVAQVPGLGAAAGGALPTAEMNRMIALHHPYKWGGGHASFDSQGPWDCSGAVSWLVHSMGLLNGHPITSTGFMTQGESGAGKTFTIYANPTHVFIKVESGQYAGQCWGTTSRVPSKGGSLAWHQHTTAGFVARHYQGW